MLCSIEAGGQEIDEIGVFDIPQLVENALARRMIVAQRTYQKDRSREQISNHLPIWVRVEPKARS